jgi:hypothetical protein
VIDHSAGAGQLLEAALEYGRRGFAVFPGHSLARSGSCTCGRPNCASPGKHPRIKEWQLKASTDPLVISEWWRRWPDANVCIATGAISGVIVIDVDPRHGGNESLAALERDCGPLPATVTSKTGGGGSHLFFQHPGHDVPNRTNVLPGIDVRGDGGFVVAPPSAHASGREYTWM